ncbi:hypothetical protein N2488_06760 [SAR92 clade bacterium H231]|nr:hypothetical protein [SAR92 clade bacterium H231]
MDARGNVINEELGNGVTRTALYEHNTGLLSSLGASLGASTFQNLDLQWDQVGNLEQRKETGNSRNLTENFLYDGLNRLKSSQVVGSSAQTLTYNAIGNITNKSDVGNYSYGAGAAGPHAVTSAGGNSYTYDANGNNISGDGRTISYTSFDKPSQIIKGNHKVEFEYGPDRSRYRRTDTNSSNGRVTDTLYIGSVEKITNPDGSKEWKRTLGNIVIKQTFNSSGTQTAKTEHYLLKDHLGSPSLIMDKVAQVQQTMDFDPWGARRTTNWSAMSSTELTNTFFKNHSVSNSVGTDSLTSRGFTGHEMLDEVGIIHMNGRIYDAKLGRFLQADPFVQFPYNTQGLNRYSYINNNPLNAIDPSGYGIFDFVLDAIKIVVAVVVGVSMGCWECAAYIIGTLSSMQTLANGGSFGDALLAGVSSAALTYVGGQYAPGGFDLGYTLKMATLGGITSVLQGGKFGHGFFGAGVGAASGGLKFAGTATQQLTKRVLSSAIIGGTVSRVTGGKFANGAAYAAFASIVSSAAHATADGQLGSEPEHISDDVIVNKDLQDVLTVDGNKISGTVRIASADAGTADDLNSFVKSANAEWNGKTVVASNGEEYVSNISFEASSLENANIVLRSNFTPFAPTIRVDAIGGSEVLLRPGRYWSHRTTPGHEVGHNFGLHHQRNPTNSIMSYSPTRSLQGNDVGRLVEAYR